MLLILVLWLAGCVARRMRPSVPKILWISTAFLFFQGWWLIANAQSTYDPTTYQFDPRVSLVPMAPGAIDQQEATVVMIRITGLLGIMCFVADLTRREAWRRRVWWTIAGCGGSLILFGLIQRISGAPSIFWQEGETGGNFFATYYYHGNAGAFINLVIPPIAGLALMAFRKREGSIQRAIWIPCFFIALAGAFANASKAAIVITIILLIALICWRVRVLVNAWRVIPSTTIRVFAPFAVAISLLSLGWFGWDRMTHRWAEEDWVSQSAGSRLLSYQASWSMVHDSGWWGFGPGNFALAFPHYTGPFGNKLEGIWLFAHEDYLQTLIEWGWIGVAVWGLLFLGGILSGVRTYVRDGNLLSSGDRALLFTSLLSLTGIAIHATMDFPLQIASLQLYTAVLLGMVLGSQSWRLLPAISPTSQ
jgi:O-antigen ligase